MDVRAHDADHGDAAHRALVAAVRDGDADTAGELLRTELLATQARLSSGAAAGGTGGEAR
jgi:DNA-binding GntR family transcriptional regulator